MILILFIALGCVVAEETNDILAVRNESAPITTSPSGVFRGSWMTSRRGRQFQAYRGIRYAEPPVGDLRFQPPKPILKYESPVDASQDGPACPQPGPEGYPISEDCLTVNVYTANNSTNLQPVVVYIHGGGLYSMSGRSDQAGPHYLLDKDIVLVTMNYRIGSLGFLALGTKSAPGNNGYKDQVVALRWVKRNIAAFGGDPNLVTLTGCSAGAASVMLHMISPMSKGLFHRAISMSGSPVAKIPSPTHLIELAEKQAKIVGCPINDTRMYDCLKTKTWKELAGSLMGFFEFGYDPLKLWSAVVEPDFGQERFLPVEPMDAIRDGNMHAVPFIIGLTRDEFFWKAFTVMRNATLFDKMRRDWETIAPISFILPNRNASDIAIFHRLRMSYFRDKEMVNDTFTTEFLGKLYSDSITGFSVHRMAVLMCLHSPHPVYYYMFNHIGNHSHYEDPITNKPVGVAHHDDLIYLFTLSRLFPAINVSDSEDSKMVDKMTTIWFNFAKTGKPNPSGGSPELQQNGNFTWPAMTMDNRTYLRIDKEFSVHEKLFENRFEVWEDHYRIDYLESPVSDKLGNSGAWCKTSVFSSLLYTVAIKALYKFTRHVCA